MEETRLHDTKCCELGEQWTAKEKKYRESTRKPDKNVYIYLRVHTKAPMNDREAEQGKAMYIWNVMYCFSVEIVVDNCCFS